jgi:predicted RNA binding protein YcfA (HicA-like mRNA interferase family)
LIYHAAMTGKEVIAKLKAAGWVLSRVNGSHHVSRDIGAGLLAAIQRQTGVKLK